MRPTSSPGSDHDGFAGLFIPPRIVQLQAIGPTGKDSRIMVFDYTGAHVRPAPVVM